MRGDLISERDCLGLGERHEATLTRRDQDFP